VWASFLGALLFAAHPIHTEAVAWVASFPEVSFALFYLMSFYGYIRWREHGSEWAYALSLLSYLLAVFSKEPALTLPLLLPVYDYLFRGRRFRAEDLARYLPYAAIIGLYLGMRFAALGAFAQVSRHADLSAFEHAINVFPLFARYLEKLVLPLDLNFFHVFHPIHGLLEPRAIASIAVTLAFAVLTLAAYRKSRTAFVGLVIIVVPLLPVLYIPGVGENTFAERYLYLPSVGLSVVVATLWTTVRVRKPKWIEISTAALLVVAGLFALGTLTRNAVWKNDLRLWTDTVARSPGGYLPHTHLGDALMEAGRTDEAIEHYRAALELRPGAVSAHNNLGLAYLYVGRTREAVEQLEITARLDPRSPEAHNNLGLAYKNTGRIDEAIASYLAALDLYPDHAGLNHNLANAYELKGMHEKAEEYRQRARVLERRLL
jgi:tetratricopeptide (TPR) repeat protein